MCVWVCFYILFSLYDQFDIEVYFNLSSTVVHDRKDRMLLSIYMYKTQLRSSLSMQVYTIHRLLFVKFSSQIIFNILQYDYWIFAAIPDRLLSSFFSFFSIPCYVFRFYWSILFFAPIEQYDGHQRIITQIHNAFETKINKLRPNKNNHQFF